MTPTIRRSIRPRRVRRIGAVAAALAMLPIAFGPVAAHGPDPFLGGGLFDQNEDLRFRWRAGSEPTAAIKAAIKAAAADATATRASKSASFTFDSSGPNPIGYGLGATCGVNGLACFTRSAPDGFTMWLREQGHVFDWGTLKWCQAYGTAPSGCYDAETIALDEFGHVEGLNHHINYADDSDYADAVVQTFSRTKPAQGWNQHYFGRCDVATLQARYDVPSASAKLSTCLDLATVLTISASPAALATGGTTTLTANLQIVDSDAYYRLGGNGLSGRTVTLQRRPLGSTTWATVGAMPAAGGAGNYAMSQSLTADMDYRAVFRTPADEGINGDTSPTVRVDVVPCSTMVGGAVAAMTEGGGVPCI